MRNVGDRLGCTSSLTDLVGSERSRLYGDVDGTRREQLHAAERQRAVYRAWNEVCANTREGQHVTGLKYLPETNELLVYAEAGSWATELSMMREVIRARMSAKGVDLVDFIFKTSHAGYAPVASKSSTGNGSQLHQWGHTSHRCAASTLGPSLLDEGEVAELDEAVEPIEDAKLKEALKKAMGASLAWKKSEEHKKEP